MQGINLFVHAVRMVLDNLGVAVRISGVLMAVQFGVGLMFGGGRIATGGNLDEVLRSGASLGAGLLIVMVVSIVTSLWIAVAWHRFVLREEVPAGPIPAFNGGAIGAYFVAGIIFALILIVLAIPIGFLSGLILFPFIGADGRPGVVGIFLFALAFYLPLAYVGYRLSPILPSAALQVRMPLKEAWYATGTSGSAFIVLTVVSVLASLILSAPAGILGTLLGSVWSFLAQWVIVLVGASILTTIYGHYVEGRALNV